MLSTHKKRIEWIDCAKGITIILVILGHVFRTGTYGSLLRGMIFSFHMPLFFILSSITYKYSKNEFDFIKNIRRSAKHLLVPALFVVLYWIFYNLINNRNLVFTFKYWKDLLYTIIFASGVSVSFAGINIPALGIPWFFIALFIGRTIFDFLQMFFGDFTKKLLVICSILSFTGVLFGQSQWLIFSFDIALACQVFFFAGFKFNSYSVENHPWKLMFIALLVWLITLLIEFPNTTSWTYLELAQRRYPLFPLCILTAISGTLFISLFSFIFAKTKFFSYPLKFIGKNSLYLLLIHCFDFTWAKYWKTGGEFKYVLI